MSKYLKEEEKELLMSQKGKNCKKNILFFQTVGKHSALWSGKKSLNQKKCHFLFLSGFLSRFGAKATYWKKNSKTFQLLVVNRTKVAKTHWHMFMVAWDKWVPSGLKYISMWLPFILAYKSRNLAKILSIRLTHGYSKTFWS